MKNTASYIRNFVLFVLLSIKASALLAQPADPEADSIRAGMKHLSGEELLVAHSNLCRLASSQDDGPYESACIKAYIAEAGKQKNVEREGFARSMQLVYYCNAKMHDSLQLMLPVHLEFMGKHRQWDYYYNSWNTLFEDYLYGGKLQSALAEAKKMYQDAKANQSNYGLGVSAYAVAMVYHTMQRYEEAEQSYAECIEALKKEEDITLLLSAYHAMSETLDGLGKYDRMRRIAAEWKTVIDNYKRKAESEGRTPALNGRYMYCTLAAAIAELETNHLDQAALFLQQAKEYARGRKATSQLKVLQVEARYYAACGDFAKGLSCNNENIALLTNLEDSVSLLTVEEQQADYLLRSGQFEQSARLYRNLLPRKDKTRTTELAAQLDDLRTIYEVDKLTLKNEIANSRLLFAIVVSGLLLLTVILYLFYTIRLRRKNRLLVQQIKEREAAQEKSEMLIRDIPIERLSQEQILFQQIKLLLDDESVLCSPDLTRDTLAKMLGSNSRYVIEAIKSEAGDVTFSAYINQLRVKHGRILLESKRNLSIDEIAELCGFSSRSRFHSAFCEVYNLTPGEFRKALK